MDAALVGAEENDMSEQALKSIASGTGTFPVLKDRAQDQLPGTGGNAGSTDGKVLPERNANARPNLEKLAQQLNMASQSIGRDLRFRVDLDSGQSVIQVLDRETGEVIRQIPGEMAVSLHGGPGASIKLYDELV